MLPEHKITKHSEWHTFRQFYDNNKSNVYGKKGKPQVAESEDISVRVTQKNKVESWPGQQKKRQLKARL